MTNLGKQNSAIFASLLVPDVTTNLWAPNAQPILSLSISDNIGWALEALFYLLAIFFYINIMSLYPLDDHNEYQTCVCPDKSVCVKKLQIFKVLVPKLGLFFQMKEHGEKPIVTIY